LVPVHGVPLILRVVTAAREVVEEVVVVDRPRHDSEIEWILPPGVVSVRDARRLQTPLVGLLAGGAALRSPYALALGCDQPFLAPPLLAALFAQVGNHDAAVPRWPNGMIEPLVAVYRKAAMVRAADGALAAGERSNQEMLDRIRDVHFVATDELRRFDPHLRSFVNVNTPADLERAKRMKGSSPVSVPANRVTRSDARRRRR